MDHTTPETPAANRTAPHAGPTPEQLRLLDAARIAAERAYAPYSRFRVGAAVLADGVTHPGANVENASANLGMCAERAALARAVAEGAREIAGVAVFCLDAPAGAPPQACLPCGGCRQWLAELAPHAWIVCGAPRAEPRVYALNDLLPLPFTLAR
ncbi:MAG: cytidine deaminase [Desulfovibrionaceae bacterium]|jgi:cytidine deaminase|nr:cytidine deaminase [Desulfovibrionaceae bacterium]